MEAAVSVGKLAEKLAGKLVARLYLGNKDNIIAKNKLHQNFN